MPCKVCLDSKEMNVATDHLLPTMIPNPSSFLRLCRSEQNTTYTIYDSQHPTQQDKIEQHTRGLDDLIPKSGALPLPRLMPILLHSIMRPKMPLAIKMRHIIIDATGEPRRSSPRRSILCRTSSLMGMRLLPRVLPPLLPESTPPPIPVERRRGPFELRAATT